MEVLSEKAKEILDKINKYREEHGVKEFETWEKTSPRNESLKKVIEIRRSMNTVAEYEKGKIEIVAIEHEDYDNKIFTIELNMMRKAIKK